MVRNTETPNGDSESRNFNPESFMNEILDSNESDDDLEDATGDDFENKFEDDFADEFEDDFADDFEDEDEDEDDFEDESLDALNEFEDLDTEATVEAIVPDNTSTENETVTSIANGSLPDPKLESDDDLEPELESDDDLEPELESDDDLEPELESDDDLEPELESDDDLEPELESDDDLEPELESDDDLEPELESDDDLEPELESDDDLEPELESNEETHVTNIVTRENTAAVFLEMLDDNSRSNLINTFANAWRSMINDAGSEDFQESIRELKMRHSIAMEHLEMYGDGENTIKLKLAQEDIEEIESAIAHTTARSKAPEEMTLGMVRFSLDLGSLLINESNLENHESLFIPGIQFKGETYGNRIDIVSTRQRNSSSPTERRTRTVERSTKPCTEIVIYQQDNNDSIDYTFNGREYGVRPLTNATIILAEQKGSVFEGHGCTWDADKDEYVMPRREDCKNLPFTAGGDGEGKAQVHFLASLACSTGRRVTGMHHGEIEFDMIPDTDGGLRIIDVNGEEYRTGKIRTEAKTSRLNLID